MSVVRRRDWTAAEYFASSAKSRSDLHEFADNVGLYAGHLDGSIERDPPSAAMTLGTMVHTAILEPDRWAEECAVLADRIVMKLEDSGRGMKAREAAWLATLKPDAIVCTATQYDALVAPIATANRMTRSLARRATPAAERARRIIELSEREVTYTWTDDDPQLAAGPMECRARIDLLSMTPDGPAIFDLKTTLDPSEAAFARSAAKLRYLWQPAHYGAPIFEETGIAPAFSFICLRSKPPYEVGIYKVDPQDIAIAQEQVRRTMRAMSQCIASGDWSAPWEHGDENRGYQTLRMPPYWAREQ